MYFFHKITRKYIQTTRDQESLPNFPLDVRMPRTSIQMVTIHVPSVQTITVAVRMLTPVTDVFLFSALYAFEHCTERSNPKTKVQFLQFFKPLCVGMLNRSVQIINQPILPFFASNFQTLNSLSFVTFKRSVQTLLIFFTVFERWLMLISSV